MEEAELSEQAGKMLSGGGGPARAWVRPGGVRRSCLEPPRALPRTPHLLRAAAA